MKEIEIMDLDRSTYLPTVEKTSIKTDTTGFCFNITTTINGREREATSITPEMILEAAANCGAVYTSGQVFRMYHPGEGKNYAFTTVKTTTGEWTVKIDELILSVAQEYGDRMAAYLFGRYEYMFGWNPVF